MVRHVIWAGECDRPALKSHPFYEIFQEREKKNLDVKILYAMK